MRTELERQAKLAECLSHATPKYNAAGDCSVWEYWREFAAVLEIVAVIPTTASDIERMRKLAVKYGQHQTAAMYSWMLEAPTPVIDDEGHQRAYRRAKAQGKPMYLWADSKGTHVSSAKPDCRCEVIEPPDKPSKRTQVLHVPAAFKRKAE